MARKLLNESAIDPRMFCEPYCVIARRPDGICPSICSACPPACIPPPPPPLIEIPPPPPPPPPPPRIAVSHKASTLSLPLTISLAILATTFFLFTCYTIYRFYSSWRNSRRRQRQQPDEGGPDDFLDEDHGPVVDHPIWYIRTIGLQPSVISAITVVKYKREDGLIEGTDCSVCLNEFQEDETLRLLPKCNHAFHIPCIDTWLRSHTNCPMCRAGIVNNAAAAVQSPEPVVQDSGPVLEENQLEVSGSNNRELVTRNSENEPSELRPGIEDDGLSRSQSELKINENLGGLDGVQPMRRSVSVDSFSASMISSAITIAFAGESERNSDNQLVEVKESIVEDVANRVGFNRSLLRLVGSPSIERSMQNAGTSSIKRSVSCSAKVFLSRHSSRSRNSVYPQ